MDARAQAWIDQERAQLTTIVRRNGWAIQYVGGTWCSHPDCSGVDDPGPPFAYTIGLFGLGHPELLIFGVPPELATDILNAFGRRIHDGENLLPGQLCTLPGVHHQFVVEHVPNPGEIVFVANEFYERPAEASVPALQLTYDDGYGVFPWDEAYGAKEAQPRPGTFQA